jgi:hypothetical protein
MGIKLVDYLTLFFLFILLMVTSFLFIDTFYPRPVESFSPYELKINNEPMYSKTNQFFPNMRFVDERISFYIEPECLFKSPNYIYQAFEILEENTVLEFYQDSKNPEILIICSQESKESQSIGRKSYYIAGEGGPTNVINVSERFIILEGQVTLFRDEQCNESKLALHELLHVLGFDHSNNPRSIMYPVTACNQVLDESIIDEINLIYSVPSLPDIAIENVEAKRVSRQISLNMTIANYGFKNANDVSITIKNPQGDLLYQKTIDFISVGTKKIFSLENLRVWSNSDLLIFEVKINEEEISLSNNRAEVSLIK